MDVKTVIKCKVEDQSASIQSFPTVSSGGVNETEINVTFSSQWEGLLIKCVFLCHERDTYHVDVVDGRVIVPYEVTRKPGQFAFGFYGVSGESVVRTSTILRYNISYGTLTDDTQPPAPSPDIYVQLLQALAAVKEYADEVVVVDSLPESGNKESLYVCNRVIYRWDETGWLCLSGASIGEGENEAFSGARGKALEDKYSKIVEDIPTAATDQQIDEIINIITEDSNG